ncbi:hypothetical protein NNJEOMEG_02842 [Fundidesulfovibrio magnetotacticus]|uniref:HipA-like C-terminal domain-containing protein n=1 Tax=Fundidesulfovibrio magnetotacticus TaxID=2730080 RepID=A0A6V8LTE1_9BACT|nr:phosphatidylinositol kinase [Fundidesulfovibrio magnetotacticus]GFK94994.1 hypothetical protein NNJEOMEG_02842 [Fundidesulfovibrio magnetotacticus]
MYPIVHIPANIPGFPEQIGTKEKFWLLGIDGYKYLYKIGRPGTGENWAEIVSYEICRLLCLPHAEYSLATWRDTCGVITRSFVPDGHSLYLGNDIMSKFVHEYDANKRYKQTQYTIGRVFHFLNNEIIQYPIGFPSAFTTNQALSCFVGYILLDALIANQDRHHENWGLILNPEGKAYLAPTFDHASSLGRNESDRKRTTILTTKDMRQHITAYVTKARTPFYTKQTEKSTLTTINALEWIGSKAPDALHYWTNRLNTIKKQQLLTIFSNIDRNWINDNAINFSLAMLALNTQRINKLAETIK